MYNAAMGEIKTLITAEQLPAAALDRRVELVCGEIVEMSPVGKKHSRIVVRLGGWLDQHVSERGLGTVGSEAGFVLSRRPDTVRAPDVHFSSASRSGLPDDDGYFEGGPDLAIEVLSPSERPGMVERKIAEYFRSGSRLVVTIDPASQTITVHGPSAPRSFSGDERVNFAPVLPDFSFRVSDLFRL